MKKLAIFTMCVVLLGGCTNASVDTAAGISQLVNVQGQDHRVIQKGAGNPVVVFVNGLGGSFTTWWNIQDEASHYTETLSYARAGYRGTPRPVGTRDASNIVLELRALLAQRGLSPPYVLVGHSLGGLYIQYYARNYPDEVAGLVLVDSSHWDQSARMPRKVLSRAVGAVMEKVLIWGVASDEAGAFEITQRQVRESPPLHPMPLTVLTAGLQGEEWHTLQREIAGQLPAAQHTIAELSGHIIQKDQPELVSAAVREIVSQLREK